MQIPKITDSASVASYLTSLVSAIIGVIVLIHPGYKEPAIVQGLIPAVSFVISGGAQVVNIITHRSLQKAALKAHVG